MSHVRFTMGLFCIQSTSGTLLLLPCLETGKLASVVPQQPLASSPVRQKVTSYTVLGTTLVNVTRLVLLKIPAMVHY